MTLYTVKSESGDRHMVLPAVLFLMKKKDLACYTQCWTFIKEVLLENELPHVRTICTDFERSISLSFRNVFTEIPVDVTYCAVHFQRSLRRKVRSISCALMRAFDRGEDYVLGQLWNDLILLPYAGLSEDLFIEQINHWRNLHCPPTVKRSDFDDFLNYLREVARLSF